MKGDSVERIQKIIANSGYCSRRKAEELIKAGKVKLNDNNMKIDIFMLIVKNVIVITLDKRLKIEKYWLTFSSMFFSFKNSRISFIIRYKTTKKTI